MAAQVREFLSDEVVGSMSEAALVQLQRVAPSAIGLRECARRSRRSGRGALVSRSMRHIIAELAVRDAPAIAALLDHALALVDDREPGVRLLLVDWRTSVVVP